MTKLRKAALPAAVVALAVALTGCAGGASPSGDAETRELRLVSLTPTVGGWDPTQWAWDGYTHLAEAAYDGLLHATDKGFEPGLATEWSWDGPLSFEMSIRPDLTFADGTALTAEVVKANIENFKNSTNRFASRLAPIETIEAVDEYTVQISLSTPQPDLELLFSQAPGMMLSEAALADPSKLIDAPDGISPYILDAERSTPDVRYVFDKNEDYWDADNLPFDRLTFDIQGDRQASFNALQAGQLDIVWGTAMNEDAAIASGFGVFDEAGAPLVVQILDAAGTVVPALADQRVRHAMAYAIDRDAFSQVFPGRPTTVPLASTTEAYDPALEKNFQYDPEKARELLEEAGYADGLTLPISCTPDLADAVAAVAGYLAEVGITLDITTLPQQEFVATIAAGNLPLIFARATSTSAAADITSSYFPNGGRNPLKNELPGVVETYTEAVQQDAEGRAAGFREINRLIQESGWTIPVEEESYFYFYAPTVTGLHAPVGYIQPTLRLIKPVTD